MAGLIVDVGTRYGMLVSVAPPRRIRRPDGKTASVLAVRCDCGSPTKEVLLNSLRRGHTGSCGCQVDAARLKHGMSGHPIWKSWASMKHRCGPNYNGERPNYIGVKHDPRWVEFAEFYADMGATWFPGAVIGRRGDTGDYTIDNCRWITRSENSKEAVANTKLRKVS